MQTHSARRINWLASQLGARRYLEIGVNRGATFLGVQMATKVAVDPKFMFDHRRYQSPSVRFHEMTSDRYFAEVAGDEVFDIVFIDGLHTFEQTLRDFQNSLEHCHARTVWVIDDTVPCDVHSTMRDQGQAIAARVAAGGKGAAWHGDVFKLVFALHDFFPGCSYVTAETGGNPQTIVWQQQRKLFVPLLDDVARISQLTFDDLQGMRQVLNAMSEDAALRRAVSALGKMTQ